MLPRLPDGSLDIQAAQRQLGFLKDLLYNVSRYALWALTGSTMATFWWVQPSFAMLAAFLFSSQRPSMDSMLEFNR